ncbi:MAG TPA: histidinol-phosphate transaminase [Polyangiaceae bacterium]|jgi:histidinol-phosphate aminotransferase|nr:histidinol-phosphate transaminase [Polyangiaceae bacterium]
MANALDLLRPELADVKSYLPTLGEFRIRLDANEAPPLLPPSVKQRLAEEFGRLALERYPDATTEALRGAIARRLGIDPAEVLLGVGSDELITLLLTAVTRPRHGHEAPAVLTTTPTFVMYRMSAKLRGQRVIEVPLDADWNLSEQSLLRGIEMSEPHVIFIASPNNPTGTVADDSRLERVIQAATSSLVVLDEAYVNYADRDRLELFKKYENVVVLRTLSKIGFAALRVGFLVGRRELVAELDKLRLPYNLSSVSQALATVVLQELWGEVERMTTAVKAERARVASALAALPGLGVTPSQANFLWVKTERPAEALFRELGERGVLVRSFHSSAGRLAQQLRITIGTPTENDELIRCLRELT